MSGVANSSGPSLAYSSDDSAFVDCSEEASLQQYRGRAPLKAGLSVQMPRIDASPHAGTVGEAVRDLEARARVGSATRTVGNTSAKRSSTESPAPFERRAHKSTGAPQSPEADTEPEPKRVAPDRLIQPHGRSPAAVGGTQSDQVVPPEAIATATSIATSSLWSTITQPPAGMTLDEAMEIGRRGAAPVSQMKFGDNLNTPFTSQGSLAGELRSVIHDR